MKKSSLPALAIIAATAISIMSCKKNNDASAQPNNSADGQTMTAFMQSHGPRF